MKKRLLVVIGCIPVIWLSVFVIVISFFPKYDTVVYLHEEPLVFVTTYGKKYHEKECHYLKESIHPIGKEKAKKQGYTACSYCNGIAKGTILVEYTEIQKIDNTPSAIIIASIVSIVFTVCFATRLLL